MWAFVLWCALLGLAIGSFLTVVVHRVPRGLSIVRPGSHCPVCGTAVRPRDNVPVVSWLLLRGRCRACGTPIGARYPLIEAATGLAFASAAVLIGPSPLLAVVLVGLGLLVAGVAALILRGESPGRGGS